MSVLCGTVAARRTAVPVVSGRSDRRRRCRGRVRDPSSRAGDSGRMAKRRRLHAGNSGTLPTLSGADPQRARARADPHTGILHLDLAAQGTCPGLPRMRANPLGGTLRILKPFCGAGLPRSRASARRPVEGLHHYRFERDLFTISKGLRCWRAAGERESSRGAAGGRR